MKNKKEDRMERRITLLFMPFLLLLLVVVGIFGYEVWGAQADLSNLDYTIKEKQGELNMTSVIVDYNGTNVTYSFEPFEYFCKGRWVIDHENSNIIPPCTKEGYYEYIHREMEKNIELGPPEMALTLEDLEQEIVSLKEEIKILKQELCSQDNSYSWC